MVKPPLGQVEMLSPDFEQAANISKRQGEKKGKALAALDHFALLDANAIPERLKQVVKAAYVANGGNA